MNDLIVELIPLMVGAALVPLYPIVVLLLLRSQGGLLKAIAFVLGGLMVRVLQGVLFGFIFGTADETYPNNGLDLIVATLLLVVGLMLLIAAFKKWRKEEDPEDQPPKWMNKLSDLSAGKALGAGAVYVFVAVKQWVFTLSAIGVIGGAELGGAAEIGMYLLFVLTTQILVLPPILAYAVAPQKTAKPLQKAEAWLERHNRTIVVTVSLVFGIWFSFKGISGLVN
jgi:hypothetical protein